MEVMAGFFYWKKCLDMRNWLEHGRISRFHQMDKPRWTWEMSFAKVKPQKMVDLGIYSKPQKNYIEQIQFTMIFFTLFVSLLVLHFCGMVEAADRMCVETRNSTCNQKRMIGCAKTNYCNYDNQHQSTVLSFFLNWNEGVNFWPENTRDVSSTVLRTFFTNKHVDSKWEKWITCGSFTNHWIIGPDGHTKNDHFILRKWPAKITKDLRMVKKKGNIARKIADYWPNLWWNRVPKMVLYLWPINLQSLINRRWIPVHVARSPMFTAGGLPNVATKNSQFLPRFTEYNPICV